MADTAVLAPATHKQPSRKGKKAWRKNVDLTQVQEGIDTVRDEIVQGGVITEKDASELFAFDSFGDAQIEKQLAKSKKLLKADEILAQRSAVTGLEGRKRKHEPVVPTSSKRQKDGSYVTHKELQRLKKVAALTAGSLEVELSGAAHDPWGAQPIPKHAELDFIPAVKPVREPRTLKQVPLSLAANGKSVPAVRKPAGGKSYNPLVGDWSDLLAREGEAAVVAEKARLQAEADAEEKEARALEEAAKVEAAEREDWATDYESEWEGFQSEAEPENFTKKMQKRKTPTERNKVKARKEREAREKWEKKQKLRDEQAKNIKAIAKEFSAKDRATRPTGLMQDANASSSDTETGEPELQRRRFGKVNVPEAPLEVVLPDELQDSLRRLKPEGNLLTDRYRNLLINGKMEVRRRRGPARQAKTERTEKWSYKDWKLK